MSTTEDRPPTIHTSGRVSLGHGTNVWTEPDGDLYGIAQLGAVNIVFHSPQQVRDVIAYLAALAGEMDAEIKRQRPAEVVDDGAENQAGPSCARCGSGAVVTLHADGEYRCHNPKRCAERVAARDAEAAQVQA